MTRFSRRLPALLCASATLAAPVTANAQSNVSVYGLIDLSAGQFQTAGAAKTRRLDSGNMTTSFSASRAKRTWATAGW